MLVLQQFRSSEEVGVYFAVVKTLALVSFIHYAMSATTAHRFAEYHALGDKPRLSAYVAHAIKWTFWPSLAATVLLLALGKPLLWLFGSQFVSGYDIMFIAAIGLVVRSAIGPVERLLNMLGHQHICALAYALAFVMNVALCVALVPRFGGHGAAAATSISLTFETVLLFWIVRHRLGLHVLAFGKRLLAPQPTACTAMQRHAPGDAGIDDGALLRGPAAVDREVGAGDLRRVVAAQEQRQRRDLLRGDEFLGRLRVQQHVLDDLLLGHAARLHGLRESDARPEASRHSRG